MILVCFHFLLIFSNSKAIWITGQKNDPPSFNFLTRSISFLTTHQPHLIILPFWSPLCSIFFYCFFLQKFFSYFLPSFLLLPNPRYVIQLLLGLFPQIVPKAKVGKIQMKLDFGSSLIRISQGTLKSQCFSEFWLIRWNV